MQAECCKHPTCGPVQPPDLISHGFERVIPTDVLANGRVWRSCMITKGKGRELVEQKQRISTTRLAEVAIYITKCRHIKEINIEVYIFTQQHQDKKEYVSLIGLFKMFSPRIWAIFNVQIQSERGPNFM